MSTSAEKGSRWGEATARAIGQAAAQAGIALSLHAPYFVNPANPEPDSQAKTAGYVLAACRVARWMGGGPGGGPYRGDPETDPPGGLGHRAAVLPNAAAPV